MVWDSEGNYIRSPVRVIRGKDQAIAKWVYLVTPGQVPDRSNVTLLVTPSTWTAPVVQKEAGQLALRYISNGTAPRPA